jgi:hypothetical protein
VGGCILFTPNSLIDTFLHCSLCTPAPSWIKPFPQQHYYYYYYYYYYYFSHTGSGIDRLFEGDPAPSEPFQELVSIKTENALGEAGAKRLVPWLRDSSDYLIVVCDPRMKSPELRQTARTLRSELDATLRSKLILINADTPAENRRWMKKTSSTDPDEKSSSSSSSSSSSISSLSSSSASSSSSIDVYSDEKMEWMRAYTALGEKRWSMTMFILADRKVQKIARDLEAVAATRVIQNAAKSMSEPRI